MLSHNNFFIYLYIVCTTLKSLQNFILHITEMKIFLYVLCSHMFKKCNT